MLQVGDASITTSDGFVVFSDPRRDDSLKIPIADFPVLLDLIDSLGLDRRRALRVPALHFSGELVILVEHEGDSYSGNAVNISRGGCLVEFQDGDAPTLPIEDQVTVSIQLDDLTAAIDATIRRCDGSQCGIEFNSPIPDSTETTLREILARIESDWINRRVYGFEAEHKART